MASVAQREAARWLQTLCGACEARIGASRSYERYYDDPVSFCREVLGFEPWEAQRRVLNALARHDAVSVPAGRAVGKSRLDAAAVLWFLATRGKNTRVVCTAPTFKQVQQILWEELRNLFHGAKIPFRGDCARMAATGLRMAVGAQAVGITADKPEEFNGIRAANLLIIADEASGIRDDIFHALEGNAAGGAKVLLTGNPTKSKGYFRESFREDSRFEVCQISALESPNVVSGTETVKGLATRDWVEARRHEWGEDSPLYKIHVVGQVVEGLEGRLFPPEMIAAAEARWEETKAEGRLVIGVDPAGESTDGDESAFAVRIGLKVVSLFARRGLSEEAILTEVLGCIATHSKKANDEIPLVFVDKGGYLGARICGHLGAHLVTHEDAFELVGVLSGERAQRKPKTYDRVRDEIWYALVDRFREGLAIPEDLKLQSELAAFRAEVHSSGRSKVTAKPDLKIELGRSPDRADALSLACMERAAWKFRSQGAAPPPVHLNPYMDTRARGIDPFAALDIWSGNVSR